MSGQSARAVRAVAREVSALALSDLIGLRLALEDGQEPELLRRRLALLRRRLDELERLLRRPERERSS